MSWLEARAYGPSRRANGIRLPPRIAACRRVSGLKLPPPYPARGPTCARRAARRRSRPSPRGSPPRRAARSARRAARRGSRTRRPARPACGRRPSQSPLTERVIAFARVEEMRPCSWNQARSRSISDERVEVAEPVEHRLQVGVLAALDRLDEGLEDLALGVRAGRGEHVVLAVVEDVERVAAVVDAALEPPRRAREDVLLAPAEQAEVVLAVGQVLVALATGDEVVGQPLDHLAGGGALDHRLPDLVGDEAGRRDRVRGRRTRRGSRSAATWRRAGAGSCCRPRRW